MGILNATSTYKKGFQQTKENNEFSMKIFTGGLAWKSLQQKNWNLKQKDSYHRMTIPNTKF